jgi:acyl transferase domain-containing protein
MQVKPNVGHSEGASGLTSLIKTVLALENRIIPPNIHFESPNPDIPFEQGKLMVPLEATPWPDGRRQRASVNSFGIGGSNVHVVVDSAAELVPSQRRTEPIDGTGIEEEQPKLLFVSAAGEESLQRRITQVADYANNKEKHGGALQDLAYTLALLTQLSHRAYAVVQPSSPIDPSIFRAFRAMRDPHLTFVFTGQGAQWAGMGHGLMSAFPEFHRDILEMDKIIDSIGGPGRPWSLAGESGRECRRRLLIRRNLLTHDTR